MKKIMISLLLVAATMNVMAAVTSSLKLKVTAVEGGEFLEITLIQDNALADGEVGAGSAPVNWESRTMGFYASFNGKDYQLLAVKDLDAVDFELKTNASKSYKFDVISASGETVFLKDTKGSPMELSAGSSYTITIDDADVNSIVAARFTVGKNTPAPVPGEPKICFVNKHLLVENASEEIKVLKEDKDVYMAYPETSTDIDLTGAPVAPSPYYWVVFEGDTMKINLNPTLE